MRASTGILVIFLSALPGMAQEAAPKDQPKDSTPDYYPLKVGTRNGTTRSRRARSEGHDRTPDRQDREHRRQADGRPGRVGQWRGPGQRDISASRAGGVFRYRYNLSNARRDRPSLSAGLSAQVPGQGGFILGDRDDDRQPGQYTVSGREGPHRGGPGPCGKVSGSPRQDRDHRRRGTRSSTPTGSLRMSASSNNWRNIRGQSYSMELLKFEAGEVVFVRRTHVLAAGRDGTDTVDHPVDLFLGRVAGATDPDQSLSADSQSSNDGRRRRNCRERRKCPDRPAAGRPRRPGRPRW